MPICEFSCHVKKYFFAGKNLEVIKSKKTVSFHEIGPGLAITLKLINSRNNRIVRSVNEFFWNYSWQPRVSEGSVCLKVTILGFFILAIWCYSVENWFLLKMDGKLNFCQYILETKSSNLYNIGNFFKVF